MNITDKDREAMGGYINTHKTYNCYTKDILEILNSCINNISYEEAMEILRVSKKYSENNDIDENKVSEVIKVITRYINRFFNLFSVFKYNDTGLVRNYDFYNDKVNYYNQLLADFESDKFNFTKVRAVLASEELFSNYQELSDCQGLTEVNAYIRKNICSIITIQIKKSVKDDIRQRQYFIRSGNKRKIRSYYE